MTNTSDMEALLPPITSSISFLHLQKVFHFSSTSHALNIEVASRHGIFHNLTSFPYSWPLGVSLITNFCKQMHKKSVCSQTCSERVGLPLNRGATISKWSKTSPNRQAKSPRCTTNWRKLVSPDNYVVWESHLNQLLGVKDLLIFGPLKMHNTNLKELHHYRLIKQPEIVILTREQHIYSTSYKSKLSPRAKTCQ